MANANRCPECGDELIQLYPASVYPHASINLRRKYQCLGCEKIIEVHNAMSSNQHQE